MGRLVRAKKVDFVRLGERLRDDRERVLKLDQKDYAHHLGIAQPKMSLLENGRMRRLSDDVATALRTRVRIPYIGDPPDESGAASHAGTGPARGPDIAIHFLLPEEVLANSTHQILWRRLTFIWHRRNDNPGLFALFEGSMSQWYEQFGGTPEAVMAEQPKPPTKRKPVRADNLSGTVTAR